MTLNLFQYQKTSNTFIKFKTYFWIKNTLVAMETKWQQKFIKADKISKTFMLNVIFQLSVKL